jgi:hypothetical protein
MICVNCQFCFSATVLYAQPCGVSSGLHPAIRSYAFFRQRLARGCAGFISVVENPLRVVPTGVHLSFT